MREERGRVTDAMEKLGKEVTNPEHSTLNPQCSSHNPLNT
jgi:hypothetical protein